MSQICISERRARGAGLCSTRRQAALARIRLLLPGARSRPPCKWLQFLARSSRRKAREHQCEQSRTEFCASTLGPEAPAHSCRYRPSRRPSRGECTAPLPAATKTNEIHEPGTGASEGRGPSASGRERQIVQAGQFACAEQNEIRTRI